MGKIRTFKKKRDSEEAKFLQSKGSKKSPLTKKTFELQTMKNYSSSVDIHAQLKRAKESGFDFSQMGISAPRTSQLAIQRKVTVGEVGDQYEKDADVTGSKFAELLNKPDSLQRNEMEEEEMRGNSLSLGGGQVTPEYENALNQEKQSGGQSLSQQNQKIVEKHLQSKGDNIRVHTSPQANKLCRSIRAKAMTVGNHIMYANAGDYSQNLQAASKDKQELFGHEYRHTEQQGATQSLRFRVDRDGIVQANMIQRKNWFNRLFVRN